MWYFTWILGVCFAASCGIIAALWFENDPRFDKHRDDNEASDTTD